jgi:hypothetical protein
MGNEERAASSIGAKTWAPAVDRSVADSRAGICHRRLVGMGTDRETPPSRGDAVLLQLRCLLSAVSAGDDEVPFFAMSTVLISLFVPYVVVWGPLISIFNAMLALLATFLIHRHAIDSHGAGLVTDAKGCELSDSRADARESDAVVRLAEFAQACPWKCLSESARRKL